MQLSSKVRMNRLFNQGKCLDVAIDHGIANEPDFLIGLEDIEQMMHNLIVAQPDAIQVNYGQADLLQSIPLRNKPALVMRTDVGNAYNAARHREMWAVLHNPEAPILAALQMDAAAVVVNLYMIPDEPGIFRQCVENIGRLRHACERYAMPLMIEPLVMAPAGLGAAYSSLGMSRKWCRWSGWHGSWERISSKPIPPSECKISTALWRRRAAQRWYAAAAKGN